jgi:broad specificity phosphatase PhoE
MKVYLIRHATTIDALSGLTQKTESPILINKKTMKCVQSAKKKLNQIDRVFCSPLLRAKQTANLIFGDGNYTVVEDIREYKSPSKLIGKDRSYAVKYWEVEHKIDKLDINWMPDDGESFASIAIRVENFYQLLLKSKNENGYNHVAVVGHGIFFRHLILKVADIPWTKYPSLIFDVLRKLKWDNLHVIEICI